jgi:hypothetical protein
LRLSGDVTDLLHPETTIRVARVRRMSIAAATRVVMMIASW